MFIYFLFSLDYRYNNFADESGFADNSRGDAGTGGANKDQDNIPIMMLILLASIIEFWQAAEFCDGQGLYAAATDCGSKVGYAVAAGVVSTAVVTLFLLYRRMANVGPGICQGVSLFLFVWWFFATSVGTFKEPFTLPTNGFLCQWCCLIASGYLVFLNVPRAQSLIQTLQDKERTFGALYVVLFSSFVVLIAGAIACDDAARCEDEVAFSVACPVVSLSVCVATILSEKNPLIVACGSLFLAAWWFTGVSALTFEQPFVIVGNGFCGTWASFVASAIACGSTIGNVPILGPILIGSPAP